MLVNNVASSKIKHKTNAKKPKNEETKKQTGSNWVVVLLSAIVTFEQQWQQQ